MRSGMNRTVKIGTRGSDLALWQAHYVKAQLDQHYPEVEFEIEVIETTGDQMVDVALSKIGDKGLFTRQIETALLSQKIDMAVHSLKDLQTLQPEGLRIGAVCEREMPNDAFISREGRSIEELPPGARVATGSLRRRSQMLHHRPDLIVEEIRGNVPTRLRKFDESRLDGIILAYAGLNRLGYADRITQIIPTDLMLPAVGQGAVAIEICDGNDDINEMVAAIDYAETRVCVRAERAFLRQLEGGCQVPIGGLATLEGDTVTLTGFVGSLDGAVSFRESEQGSKDTPEEIGMRLAESLVELGARELLDRARVEAAVASEKVV